MGARRGGGQEEALAPPWKFKNIGAPTRITYRVKILKIIFFKLSEETELRAPHLVSEETDMRGPPIVSKETNLRGPPYSMRSNLSKGAPT